MGKPVNFLARASGVALVAIAASSARGARASGDIISVDAATRVVRVFEPRDVSRASAPRANEYSGSGTDDARWREEFMSNDHGVIGSGGAYDDYVSREVAKLEASLLTSSDGPDIDVAALQRALDDITMELRADLDRVARARAREMSWMDSSVGVGAPNGAGGTRAAAGNGAPTTRAMDGVTVIYNDNQGSQTANAVQYNPYNTVPPYNAVPRYVNTPPQYYNGGGSMQNYPDPYIRYQNDAYIIYDESGTQVLFEPQGEIGRFMQQLTFCSTLFPGNPSAFDDYARCSTLIRPCSIEEVLRKCTYEPRKTWYRERLSRMNAPIDWPYCQPDLDEVYDYCTELERQSAMCDPRRARERMYISQAVLFNGGDRPCMRWRTDIFGVRVCVDRAPHK